MVTAFPAALVIIGQLGTFTPMDFTATGPMPADYMRILSRFPIYAERGWHQGYDGKSDVGWFGDGSSDENGQRTLGNFVFVYALLGADPLYDPGASGVDQATLRRRSADALRYWYSTHVTGDTNCTDGKRWGHHWQSSWWTSKALSGATLLGGELSPGDWEAILRVTADEADHVTSFPVPVGEYGDTKSEENAWYSEVLAWAVNLMPDHPRAGAWRQRYNEFLMNTLSVAEDSGDATTIEGKAVREWYLGANIHSDYTIENHGFFHICYQSCPLHSIAWDYYAFRRSGRREPATTHHHVRDVYETLRRFYLWDGRFAYVGGKDWPRYAYGLYFMLPGLVMQQIEHRDRVARAIESKRVAMFEREQCLNADGSFFSQRFTRGIMERWPAEWETDCACMLAMSYRLHKLESSWIEPARSGEVDRACGGALLSLEAEQVSVRTPRRFVGLSWKGRGGPLQMTFGTPGTVHMMEWDGCGGGVFRVEGADTRRTVSGHHDVAFDGGFASVGALRECFLARTDDTGAPWRVTLSDATAECGEITAPEHPIFSAVRRVRSLSGVLCRDSVVAASGDWDVLARDKLGNPAIFEGRIGKGRLIVCMADAEAEYLAGRPAGGIFENAVAILRAAGPRLGYVASEDFGRQALDRLGAAYERVPPGRTDLSAYSALFVDKSTTAAVTAMWPRIMQYVRAGGTVLKLCLQDEGWDPGTFRGTPPAAIKHDVAVVAIPDGRTVLRIDRRTALRPVTVTARLGLQWHVANDIFSDNRRTFSWAGGSREVEGVTPGGQVTEFTVRGRWVNVDDELTMCRVAGEGEFGVIDYPERRFGSNQSLAAEDIVFPYGREPITAEAGQVLQETALLFAGTSRRAAESLVWDRRAKVRFAPGGFSARLRGADGRWYVVTCRYEETGVADALPAVDLPPVAGLFRDLTRGGRAAVEAATGLAFPDGPGIRVWATW